MLIILRASSEPDQAQPNRRRLQSQLAVVAVSSMARWLRWGSSSAAVGEPRS